MELYDSLVCLVCVDCVNHIQRNGKDIKRLDFLWDLLHLV